MRKTRRRQMLETLAYGRDNDAIKLMVQPGKEDISKMDLSRVAGIKRARDGTVELQLYDRYHALDELRDEDNMDRNPLLAALQRTVQPANDDDVGGDE